MTLPRAVADKHADGAILLAGGHQRRGDGGQRLVHGTSAQAIEAAS
ncbi:hypothetical protein ACGF8B_32245 [Streptomyces sp. NPDC047917]